MRFLIFLLLSTLLSIQSFALSCFDPGSGLMASVTRVGDQIEFHFSAGRGYEAIPQIEGPVSAADIPMIQFQTDQLKSLDSQFSIQIPISACDLKRAAEGIFACYKEGNIQGTELHFSALTAYKSKEDHASGQYERQHFRLMIGKEDRFFFAVPFASQYCSGNL